MFSLYLLYSSLSPDEILAKLKLLKKSSSAAIIVRSEYAVVPRFVEYAFIQAFKSFEQGTSNANHIELEWLCKLAVTKNVSNGLDKTRPTSKCFALATINLSLSAEQLCKIGAPCCATPSLQKSAEKFLKERYEITEAALKNYKLEEMLIETAAVENI